jgi:ATP-binding protein involved in chromosome partitioning|uniref:Iron-sulfur cluster carrier protein n=1 Tax=Desulfobacca acetoxidans TaxID=60893 RepID=A0A7V6DQ87_9BACT
MGDCQSSHCGHGGQGAHPGHDQDEVRLQEQLKHIRHRLLVMSGKGGVGKTSTAVYLALGLAQRGHRVGLLDVDLHGPDVPRMLGLSGQVQFDEENRLMPHRYNDHLQVVSIEFLLHDRDEAVIWRGPLKHSFIRQAISQVNWGDLDILVIDSPPGTGDEPLSVAQTIQGAQAVIVTTPQEVSLADVRKAINFCRKVDLPIMGLVENMSGLICPRCGEEIPLFSKGGGQKTSALMQVPLLASLPFDLRVVQGGDTGTPQLAAPDGGPYQTALAHLLDEVEGRLASSEKNLSQTPAGTLLPEEKSKMSMPEQTTFKVAVPLAGGVLCNHFGHCEQFAIVPVQNGRIGAAELHTPPPHEPGVLPRWLGELGVNLIIAGGMGQRALSLFAEQGIRVITGAPNQEPVALLQNYLAGSLTTGPNVCDH